MIGESIVKLLVMKPNSTNVVSKASVVNLPGDTLKVPSNSKIVSNNQAINSEVINVLDLSDLLYESEKY